MSFFRASIWAQLTAVWLVAIAVAVLLLWIDRRFAGSWKVFYLFPYPADARAVLGLVSTAFRGAPLAATALIAVPVLAITASLALIVTRVLAPPA